LNKLKQTNVLLFTFVSLSLEKCWKCLAFFLDFFQNFPHKKNSNFEFFLSVLLSKPASVAVAKCKTVVVVHPFVSKDVALLPRPVTGRGPAGVVFYHRAANKYGNLVG
jgi:hypothetical protein